MNVHLQKLRLDLNVNWKLSRNETSFKENFIVTVTDGTFKGVGEIAPNVRYGETSEVIESNFVMLQQRMQDESLEYIRLHNSFCNSFNFGLNSAFIHTELQQKNSTFSELFDIPQVATIATSVSIPIMDIGEVNEYIEPLSRFQFVKIKINESNAIPFVREIASHTDAALRIDANEGFSSLEEYLKFEASLDAFNVNFIEQPFKSSDVELYKQLKPISKYEIIADESIESNADFEVLNQCFHGINVKLMKAGSYENAIRLLNNAKKLGMKTMLGCMIETSIGISSALNLASLVDYFDLDGCLLLKNEPFGLVKEADGLLSRV